MAERTRSIGVAEALGLVSAPELISIVGGGGKSSLMFALARELPGRVIMTTTTRIFAAQTALAAEVLHADRPDLFECVDRSRQSLLVVGRVEGERALGVDRDLPFALLARPSVDWVVVEADGSRMRPAKAPADHEPVVAQGTSLLVVVAGIDALGPAIRDATHRPERVSALTGLPEDLSLTPAALARLLASSRGGLKQLPTEARAVILLNKVESSLDRTRAREVADTALQDQRIDRVVLGALKSETATPWEIWRRSASGS